VCGNFAREPRHPREEPCRGSAGMYRKVGVAGPTGHVKSYGFLRRRYVTTGPGFWIQSKVPDDLSVTKRHGSDCSDSRSR
jgi:hypothetical protein